MQTYRNHHGVTLPAPTWLDTDHLEVPADFKPALTYLRQAGFVNRVDLLLLMTDSYVLSSIICEQFDNKPDTVMRNLYKLRDHGLVQSNGGVGHTLVWKITKPGLIEKKYWLSRQHLLC